MTLNQFLTRAAGALMLSAAVLWTPAIAQDSNGLSAMQGVQAQALSAEEMQAVQGLISPTNMTELTLNLTNDPTLGPRAKKLLLDTWAKLVTFDGTRKEILADAFFLLMKAARYPNMCGLNAGVCTGPFPGAQ